MHESAAFEAARVFRVAISFVLGMLRIGAQGPAPSWECFTFRIDRYRCRALFYPIDDCAKQVKLVKSLPSAAMAHSWNKVKLAPLRDRIKTAVRVRHIFVIAEGIERRKPGIAVAVIEDYFPSMS